MKTRQPQFKHLGLMFSTLAIAAGISAAFPGSRAMAQEILREQGTLNPTQDEYTFTGTAGQAIAVTMESADFDTVLVLLDANDQEVSFNDDFGRSLNSTIVTTLPSDGEYKVIARSFSGQGGSYSISVRPATDYEQAYSNALNLSMAGDFNAAIDAYTEAIELDPSQPVPYMDRADARWSQVYASQENAEAGEEMTPAPEVLSSIIDDYRKAADLYEQAGEAELAQSIREQITILESQ